MTSTVRQFGGVTLFEGDCRAVLRELPADSLDAVVTDPPYLLEFMGKAFDRQHKMAEGANDGQRMQTWHLSWAKEVIRVMKPGSHLVSFGGDRTYHRMVSALEDAGLQIRHTLCFLYGTGFPKSRSVSKDLADTDWCECGDD